MISSQRIWRQIIVFFNNDQFFFDNGVNKGVFMLDQMMLLV